MHIRRAQQSLVLTTEPVESRILLEILSALAEAYRVQPGELDPATAAVWYSTRGCASAKMSATETAEWMESLHGFKGANLRLLELWLEQLAQPDGKAHRFSIKLEDAPMFLTVINDYRLMAAARHDIGEAEMTVGFLESIQHLAPERQRALAEISLLAWLMEATLQALSTSPDSPKYE